MGAQFILREDYSNLFLLDSICRIDTWYPYCLQFFRWIPLGALKWIRSSACLLSKLLEVLQCSLGVLPWDYCSQPPLPLSTFPPITQVPHAALAHFSTTSLWGLLLSPHWTLVLDGNRVLGNLFRADFISWDPDTCGLPLLEHCCSRCVYT